MKRIALFLTVTLLGILLLSACGNSDTARDTHDYDNDTTPESTNQDTNQNSSNEVSQTSNGSDTLVEEETFDRSTVEGQLLHYLNESIYDLYDAQDSFDIQSIDETDFERSYSSLTYTLYYSKLDGQDEDSLFPDRVYYMGSDPYFGVERGMTRGDVINTLNDQGYHWDDQVNESKVLNKNWAHHEQIYEIEGRMYSFIFDIQGYSDSADYELEGIIVYNSPVYDRDFVTYSPTEQFMLNCVQGYDIDEIMNILGEPKYDGSIMNHLKPVFYEDYLFQFVEGETPLDVTYQGPNQVFALRFGDKRQEILKKMGQPIEQYQNGIFEWWYYDMGDSGLGIEIQFEENDYGQYLFDRIKLSDPEYVNYYYSEIYEDEEP